jgi:phage tail sheath gpL-like
MLPASAISRVTGVNVEYRDFNAGAGGFLPQRLALFGVGNDDAEYSLDKYESTGSADAIAKRYGYGSPLHLMARQLFPSGGGGASFPVTIYPLAKSAEGAAAAGVISCDGTATGAGEATVTIGGISVQFAILKGQAAAATLTAAKAAIESVLEMPVIAGAVDPEDGELPVTAKWKGALGNLITIEIICDVPGISFGLTAMSGGAADSDIGPALEKIGPVWETIGLAGFGYNNTLRLDQCQVFADGRWNQLEKKPIIFAWGSSDDYATRTAVTDLRKPDNRNFLIQSTGSRELPFVIAARGLLNIMEVANSNPPHGNYGVLTGLHAGADEAQENWTTRNNAVLKGASTNIKNGSVAELNDIITFYHPDGEAIPGYRYVVDCIKLMNVVFNIRMIMEADAIKGAPLVSDATPTTNPKAVQPKTIKTAMINLANSLAAYALIQEPEFTKKKLVVKISSMNPKRLDTQFPCKLSGNVEVTSNDIYFGFYLGEA